MNFHLLNQFSAQAASIVAALVFLFCLYRWRKSNATERHPPYPAGSWPIIGHLHLLGKLPHISLGNLADKYGPIFMMKFGLQKALVVSSAMMAKQCLATNGVFVDRPRTAFVKHLTYKSAIFGFSPYGSYWREMRKIATIELLSNNRIEKFRHVRISEIRSAIKDIYENYVVKRNSETFDMKQWFCDSSLNSTVRLVVGKSLKGFYQGDEYQRISKALRDFFELGGVVAPADMFPFLKWLYIGGFEKTMKKAAIDIDHFAQEWLEVHRKRKVSENTKEKQDFMDVMVGLFEEGLQEPSEFDADTTIKATCMTIILAATDTTAVTLTWALSLLLNNKEAMKKGQDELDTHVGKERHLDESDLKNLVYLDAIIKETLRVYPAGPLSVPRVSTADCNVNDYHIPRGTQLYVNLHKIHRDPEVWQDPLEFRPERFLTTQKDFDVRGLNFEFMPFGSGRRVCPGISYALRFMQFALGCLLHGFNISTPSDTTVDMTEGFGLTNMKASPLEVILTPRLPDYLYSPPSVVN